MTCCTFQQLVFVWLQLHVKCALHFGVDLAGVAQIASKMDAEDKSTIESAVDEAISWLDTNQLAEVYAG